MAAFVNISALTLTTEMATSISEALIEHVLQSPTLSELFTIVPGIKANKQIPIFGRMGLVGYKQTDCEPTANPNGPSATEKTWQPAYIGDRVVDCYINYLDSKLWQWALRNGVNKSDLTGTDFSNFVEDELKQAIYESTWRISFFAETAMTSARLGGVAANVKYFNAINGIWVQGVAIATATPAQYVAIANNAEATYALQEFDDADTAAQVATKILRNMIRKAPMELRQAGELKMLVTQSLFDQYAAEREAATNIPLAYDRTETGLSKINIQGIEVTANPELDRVIRTYFNDGTKWENPHRAILYPKYNVMIGTEEENNLSEFDAFMDKKSKQYIVDFGYNMDAKVGLNKLFMIAY